jgi:uncharacterized integral membrane protein
MTRFLLLLVFLPLLLIIVAFTYLNAQPVDIDLLVNEYQMPLAVIILFSVLLGFVLGIIFNLGLWLGCKRENYKLKHKK